LDLGHGQELESFDFLRPDGYRVDGPYGHIASVALEDGSFLSAHGQYQLGATMLIRRKPDAGPINVVPEIGARIEPEGG
jgi:hypothetical protein